MSIEELKNRYLEADAELNELEQSDHSHAHRAILVAKVAFTYKHYMRALKRSSPREVACV